MKNKVSTYAIGLAVGVIVSVFFVGLLGAFYHERSRLKSIAKVYYKKVFRQINESPADRAVENVDNEDGKDLTLFVDASRKIAPVSPLLYGANLSPQMESEADIISFVRQEGLACFRFPGGEQGYHWKDKKFDFAPRLDKTPLNDLDSLVEFCRTTGTGLVMQVNVESGSPQEAAEMVTYLNKTLNFPVVYWELGNEVYGDWDKGYMTGKKYAQVIKDYAAAMKKADPEIKIGMDWASDTRWFFNTEVVSKAGAYIDFVSVHWYPNITDAAHKSSGRIHPLPQEVMANYLHIPGMVENIRKVFKRYAPKKEKPVEIAVLEWDGAMDAPASDFPPYSRDIVQWSLANAIFHADSLGMFASTGVSAAAQYNLQSIGFGLIKGWDKNAGWGGQRWDGETMRPKALAIGLFARHFGDVLVSSKLLNEPYYFRKKDWSADTYARKVPYVSAYASVSSKENKMSLVLINKHAQKSYKIKVHIMGADIGFQGKLYRLTGPSLLAQNDGDPVTVRIATNDARGLGKEFDYEIPAHSVNLIEAPIKYEEKQ